MAGLFISFEGIDGCGKSTQLQRFAAWARERGIEPLLVREPGGTPLGERVRELVLSPSTGDIAPTAEALLYAASRAELVASVIAPALAAGRLVVADRFVDSSLAYQGAARGLGVDRVLAANELAMGDTRPDLVVVLRIDPELAAERRAGSADDRIEAAGLEFFTAAAQAYDDLAAREPARFAVIDGAREVGEVWADVLAALEPRVAQLAAGVTA